MFAFFWLFINAPALIQTDHSDNIAYALKSEITASICLLSHHLLRRLVIVFRVEKFCSPELLGCKTNTLVKVLVTLDTKQAAG